MPARGKGPLRIAIEDFLETFGIGKLILGGVRTAVEEVVEPDQDSIDKLLQRLFDGDVDAPDDLFKFIGSSPEDPLGKIIYSFLALWSYVGAIMPGGLVPFSRILEYRLDKTARSWLPDQIMLQALRFRFPNKGEEWDAISASLGIGEGFEDILPELLRIRAPEGTLISAWFRGIVSEADVSSELLKRGYLQEDIDVILKTSLIIPNVQDLVRMAVREVFNPEQVEALSLSEEFPRQFGELAETIGLTGEWAERFWQAHWVLPSMGQAFEMFHRLRGQEGKPLFDIEELRSLIKALDVAPVWRDRLIEIAYRPYTRVDVRRMFKTGVLNEDEVFSAYQDIGYDEEKAGKLTEWTVSESRGREKDLTRASIVKAYKQRRFDRGTAHTALTQIGYGADEAEFWLGGADFELAEEIEDETIERAKTLFTEGLISQSEVYDVLGPLNLPSEQLELLLDRWNIQILKQIRIPTRGELDSFYENGIIDDDEYDDNLRKRRYADETIIWFRASLDRKILDAALREAERAQKEEERLADAVLVDAYLKANVELDVSIAEVRLEIAEIKLTLHDIVDAGIIADLKSIIAEAKVEIADLRLQKAQLRRTLS